MERLKSTALKGDASSRSSESSASTSETTPICLLDEISIFFAERSLQGKGLCTFTIPHGALEALFDEHTYIFSLPGGVHQVCLRVAFDMGVDTVRYRYEFPTDGLDLVSDRFLRIAQDVADGFLVAYASEEFFVSYPGEEYQYQSPEVFNDRNSFLRRAWDAATDGLVIRTKLGSTKRPTMEQLKKGWERMASYLPGGDQAAPIPRNTKG